MPKRPAAFIDRLYQPLESPLAPDLADRLRAAKVLDDLPPDEASAVSAAIINAVLERGLVDRSAANALQQKAANCAAGVDLMLRPWFHRGKVSDALAAAADVLVPKQPHLHDAS